ncbi:uncharacterized protein [Coffea arabica]|uniref:Tf2-1-like SH3-like domain-containing protein n=1 Tax=Coffea arabica TaxID=13443 RepID=A0ABM4W8N8_COFAR
MDFVSGLPRTQKGHDAIWVIVDRLTKTAHFLPVNMKYPLEKLAKLYMDEVVRLHGVPVSIVSDRDPRRKDLEFEIGDKVFLRITPLKGKIRAGKGKKLQPRYIGPFNVLQRIGKVAYRLELPASLSRIHDVFHVSLLKKYHPDPTHILPPEDVELDESLTYEERPIQILDRKVKDLRTKQIPLVKVLWKHHEVEEATWELEKDVQEKYPDLFTTKAALTEF